MLRRALLMIRRLMRDALFHDADERAERAADDDAALRAIYAAHDAERDACRHDDDARR